MYDLIIIGGGPGGYISAERAGAMGKTVLLIEKAHLGGVCLNAGCIPTKTLLHSSKLYAQTAKMADYGVTVENPLFDLTKAMAWKGKVIDTLRKGIAYQMKRFGVEVLNAEATLKDFNTVVADGKEYKGSNIILATGSSPFLPPIPGLDGDAVMTSTEILNIETMPESVIIIGGGYIGMEFASFFGNLGKKVTVVEMMDEIIPFMDAQFSSLLRKSLKQVDFTLGARVEKIEGKSLTYSKDGKQETIKADIILASLGRKPNLEGTGFKEAGLDIGKQGIVVNEKMQTNLPGVYAIGDVTGKSLLAHSASRMGEVAVANMFGSRDRMRYHAVPWVVFTSPEVAGCGMSEEDAKNEGLEVEAAMMQMRASGRYLAEHAHERGICKVVADKKNGKILGVHMLGSGCSEMIFGAALMIESELRVKDIKEIVFPHPTVSEIMRDTIFEIGGE
jgi:dihydrolipoamide dehydrogenase